MDDQSFEEKLASLANGIDSANAENPIELWMKAVIAKKQAERKEEENKGEE